MKNIIIAILVLFLVGGVMWFLSTRTPEEPMLPEEGITSFEECIAAGYTILESYPRQCKTPDGARFIEEIELEDETADWQTYRNEEYGYEIKYPDSFSGGGEYEKSNRYDHQVWRRNPIEEEWESLTVYVNADIAKYPSFDELWETIEKKAEDDVAKISGEKCIESFVRIPNLEGVKIFYNLNAGCMAPSETINSEAIILSNGLTFRIFHACETTLNCRNRFNQMLSTFRFVESETYNHAGRVVKIYQKDGKNYLDINFIKFLLFVDEDGHSTASPTSIYGENDEEGDCEPGPNPYCIVDNDKTINPYEVSEDILIIPSYYPGTLIPYEDLEESLAASPFFRIQIENNIIKRMHQICVP